MNKNLEVYDKNLLRWVSDMHSKLNKDQIDMKEIGKLAEYIQHLQSDKKNIYIDAILYPETVIGARIPTVFPVPSSAFQIHLNTTLSTGADGNIAWVWNPVFMQDAGLGTGVASYTSYFVNNSGTLAAPIGSSSNNNFFAKGIGYDSLPAGVYGSYKLVSASLVLSYIGRIDASSGVICAAIGLNNQSNIGGPAIVGNGSNVDAASAIFGNFNLIDNLFYASRSQAINGTRSIYFPIDAKYLNFYQIATSTAAVSLNLTHVNGFYFCGYGSGLPASTACLRADFYINIETVVQPSFANYVPSDIPTYAEKDVLKEASQMIQGNPKLVTQTSSDIPGAGSGMNIGALDTLEKLGYSESVRHIPDIRELNKYLKNA